MSDLPSHFEAAIGTVRSEAGAFRPGIGAFVRDRNLHEYGRGRRWFELYLFALTGRDLTPNEVELLETLWCYTSYPDPRIWNNRVAALAGAAHSSAALAIGAAIAVSDAHIYGLGPTLEAYDFLAAHARADDEALQQAVRDTLRQRRRLGGFGRPVVAEDERIAPLMARAAALGLDHGPHLAACHRIAALLRAGRWRLRMNYSAPAAALCLDLGLDRLQTSAYVSTGFLAGMGPVWQEARAAQVPASLLPIPVQGLRYDGPAPRPWPAPPRAPESAA